MHPDDLKSGHQCVLIRDPSSGRPFEWEFRRGKKIIPIVASGRLMVNDTGSLLGACVGGVGIAQLLELYASDLIDQKRVRVLLSDWAEETFPLYAYHHASNLMSAKVSAFLNFVSTLTA